jgi:hypothetical protein
MSFPTSALKLTQPRYHGKKQHQYHCLRCSHWTLHNSPKCQLSNVHKGFQSHLGSILRADTTLGDGVTMQFQSYLGSILRVTNSLFERPTLIRLKDLRQHSGTWRDRSLLDTIALNQPSRASTLNGLPYTNSPRKFVPKS